MTYTEFINNIIATRGQSLQSEEYYETHHIIPKCCGGNNKSENLIDLFAQEHYIAHKLLAEENPENDKLQFAWWQMCHCKKANREYTVNEEDYALAKLRHSEAVSRRMVEAWADEESRNRLQSALSNPDVRQKMSDSAKRRMETPEGQKHIKEMWSGERRLLVSKTTIQLTKQGDFVAEYFGAREASRQTGIVYSSIVECCEGKRKSAGGFIWKYKN